MMKLALDFDGVLSDTIQAWVDKYNNDNKDDLTKDLVVHRDIDEWGFYTKFDMTLDKCFEYFSKAWGDWENLIPQERHLEQKTKMLQNLVDVDIVTAVIPEHLKDVTQWLDHNHIHYRNIVRSDNKQDLDYDIYVDDATKNILKVLNAGKTGLLYNQAWNRDVPDTVSKDGGSIKRVYNLYHVIDVVRAMI